MPANCLALGTVSTKYSVLTQRAIYGGTGLSLCRAEVFKLCSVGLQSAIAMLQNLRKYLKKMLLSLTNTQGKLGRLRFQQPAQSVHTWPHISILPSLLDTHAVWRWTPPAYGLVLRD